MANQQLPRRKLTEKNLAFSEFMEEVREATDRELAELESKKGKQDEESQDQ